MKLKITTERTFARSDLRHKLRKSGINIYAHIDGMETYLQCLGFILPGECKEGYGFRIGKYTRITLVYADALATEIILLTELGKIGIN